MREQMKNGLIFKVIVSFDSIDHSLWIADRQEPPGWRDAGLVRGSAAECLACIQDRGFRERPFEATHEVSPNSRERQLTRAVCA